MDALCNSVSIIHSESIKILRLVAFDISKIYLLILNKIYNYCSTLV